MRKATETYDQVFENPLLKALFEFKTELKKQNIEEEYLPEYYVQLIELFNDIDNVLTMFESDYIIFITSYKNQVMKKVTEGFQWLFETDLTDSYKEFLIMQLHFQLSELMEEIIKEIMMTEEMLFSRNNHEMTIC